MHILNVIFAVIISICYINISLTVDTIVFDTGAFNQDLFFPLRGKSLFLPRSQSENAARDLVGWHQFINRYDGGCPYGAIEITPEYMQSYKTERIAEYLFGTTELDVAGSAVINRAENAILADYFGLSPSFKSTVRIKPRIQNALVDFGLYLGCCDYYFRIHAPVVWCKAQLELVEAICNDGTDMQYPADYMAVNAISAPATSFSQAVNGGLTWGQMQEPLSYGLFGCPHHTVKLAEIQWAFGWNFINTRCGHFGFNVRGSIPTGTRPNGRLLFQPIVGNGHHWELGAGLTSSILIAEGYDQECKLFIDLNMTHLFTDRQWRSLDICPNGFGSRYELVKIFDPTNLSYTNHLAPLINRTTVPCDVRMDFQLDFVFMFGYEYKQFGVDIGYNGWMRTKEHVEIACQPGIPGNTLGLKGIQDVSTGFGPSVATQSTATIYGNSLTDQAAVIDIPSPVLIWPIQLNPDSTAAPRALTNKIFCHLNYTGSECWRKAIPYIGVGFEVEFEGIRPKHVQPNKPSLCQWGVWSRFGVGF